MGIIRGGLARVAWFVVLAAIVLQSMPAWGLVEGQRPQVLRTFKIFGNAISTGNTMMSASPPGNVNDILLSQNSARINGVPFDGTVVAAYLWWTGSLDGTPDTSVDFTIPGGTKTAVNSTSCQTVPSQGGFFYCRADITTLAQANTGLKVNGDYTLAGLRAKPGDCNVNPQICQARYGAWAMVVVWESPTHSVRRDVVLYDGFLHMDEQPTSSGITSFTLTGFKVGDPAEGSFTFFGLEGDSFLGAPPEPDNFADFITFRSNSAASGTRLKSATPNNPPGNLWNSTIALGVDLDTFNIGSGNGGLNLIKPGDTSATLVVGTGDGIVPGGNGESVFMGFVLMTIDTLSPNFRNKDTTKRVSQLNASAGDTLTYTLRITNSGSLEAKNVIVQDAIPANTTYVPGTTRIDNVLVADVGGTSPVVNGLNLGTIDFRGDNDREVTFQVRIVNVPTAQRITNTFQVRSDEVGATTSNEVVTTLRAAQLGQFSKTVRNQTNPNGPIRPGDTIVYTIDGANAGSVTANGIQFIDDLPKFVKFVSVFPPGGSTNNSTSTGGANGTGRIDIRNLSILPNSTVRIFFTVQVFSEAEFVQAGIAADKIHGTPISNQGIARHPSITGDLKTDDPATPAREDPTVFNVSYQAIFAGSTKAVTDDNGGRAEPGDTLTYTVTIVNKGTRDTTATWEDTLPPGVDSYQQVSIPTGSVATFQPAPAGANQTGVLTIKSIPLNIGATATIVFRVKIAANVTNGLSITNVGTILDEKDSNNKLQIQSPPLVVVAGPLLDTSTKTVVDVASGQPATVVAPGAQLRYSITVNNTGNRPATDVKVTDPVPAELEQIVPAQGGRLAGTTITWDKTSTAALASIAPGASVTLTFTARVKLNTPDSTRISNQADLEAPGLPNLTKTDDPDVPGSRDPTVVIVSAKPKLATTKTVTGSGGSPGKPGDTLTYTLVVSNTGTGIAQDVVISDPIDKNLINAQSTNGRLTAGAIVWDKSTVPALASLAIGASVTLTFTAQIISPLSPSVTFIRNQAVARATGLQDVSSDDPTKPGASDPTDFPVTATAQPEVTKVVQDLNGGDVVPGDTLQYTITIKGGGNAPLLDAIITDVVPAQLNNIQPAQGGRLSGTTITWDKTGHAPLAQINPGQSVTLTFTAQVRTNLPDGTVVSNQAEVRGTGLATPVRSDDPATPAKPDPTNVTVRSRPDLTASTKTVSDVNGGQLLPGETVSYSITVRNTGNVTATNVTVTDPVDTNLTGIAPGAGGVLAGNTITWTIPSLAVGASSTLSFTAQVKSPLTNGTKISNQARITATNAPATVTDDPNTPADDDPTIIEVTSGPSFADTTKEVVDINGGQVNPGDQLRYTITVKNSGTDVARNVVVTDKIDTVNLNGVSAGQGGQFANGTITWNAQTTPALASIPINGSVSLTFVATVLATVSNGTNIDNQAEIRSQTITTPVKSDDPRTAPDDDPTRVTVVAGSALSDSTKAVRDNNGGQAQPGDTLTYTIAVKNTGLGVARNVVVTDKVDTSKLINVTPGQGGQFANGTITWNAQTTPALATLAQGGTTNLTFTAQIAPGLLLGTNIDNQAFLAADDLPTPVPTDDPATATLDDPTRIVVGGQPVLAVTKSVVDINGGAPSPGDQLRYTISISNSGGAPATNVVISDPIDTNLEQIVPDNGGQFNTQSQRILWNIPTIAPNGTTSVSFTARIKQGVFNGTTIANQAQVSAAELPNTVASDDPNTPTKDDSTDLVVSSTQRLEVTKQVTDINGGSYRPGDIVEYRITLRNAGAAPIARLIVTDRVDPNLDQIAPGNGGQLANGEIRWDANTTPALGTLAGGASTTLTFRARVLPNTQNGTNVDNQAVVTAEQQTFRILSDDPAKPGPSDPTTFVVAFPNLTLTKAARDDNGGTYEANDIVEYSITVRNSGSAPLTNVVVTDPVDGNFLEQIQPGQGGNVGGGSIIWNAQTTPGLASIAPGQSVVLTFRAKIKQSVKNGDRISNQATASSAELPTPKRSDDPNTPAPEDATVIVIQAAPNLSDFTKIVRDENGGVVRPGDRLTYTLTIRNNGSLAATSLVITDNVDTRLGSVQPGQGGRFVNGVITWNAQTTPALANLAAKGTVTLTFSAVINAQTPDGTTISNQASALSQEITTPELSDDPTTPVPDDPTRVVVQAAAGLASSIKSVQDINGGTAQTGDVLEYTIRVINNGSNPATQVRLVDPTPANTAFVTGSLRVNGVVIPDGGTNPLDQGILVRSARSGTQAGVVIPDDGAAPDDEIGTVVFRVRILPNAGNGTRIRNSGVLSAQGLNPIRTNEVVVVVGGGPVLDNTSKTYKLVVDQQNQGVADVGDVLEYTINIRNSGDADATNVVFTDPIPADSQYVAGSITYKGQPKTDGSDNDEAQFQSNVGGQGTVRINVGTLAKSQAVALTFRVRITGGKLISNQGFVTASGHPREPTDADDNDANGDQPTLTPVGTNRLLTAVKEVLDVNGGSVNPNDVLEYRITLRNAGLEDIADIKVTDQIDAKLQFQANSAQGPGTNSYDAAARRLTFTGISLAPGATALLIFRAKIAPAVTSGTIPNFAEVEAPLIEKFKTETVTVEVRQGGAQANLAGRVYQDYGADDDTYNAAEDEKLPGFKLRLYAANDLTKIVKETVSDDEGLYKLETLPVGQYKLRYYTARDVQYGELDLDLSNGGSVTRDIIVSPTGRVYNSVSGAALSDALVYLVNATPNDAPKACKEDKECGPDELCVARPNQSTQCLKKIPDGDLLEKQQGQPTNNAGMYKFSAAATSTITYMIVVRPGQGVFPSQRIRYTESVAQFNNFNDNGKIVAHDKPDLQDRNKATTYHLLFNVSDFGKIVQNNHVPIDVLGSLVILTKTASVSSATVGQIITYTLEVKNNAATEIKYDAVRRLGGLYITDIPPKGFALLGRSPRARTNDGKLVLVQPRPVASGGTTTTASRIHKYGPFDIPAQGTLTLKYQLIVGRQLPVGEYINVAYAHNSAGGRLTEDARAMVRVTYDPILDQGTVIGKIFCDKNGNRWQDANEPGVEGVRIYLDTGFYTTTDRYGKYHLQAIDPGNHMLKIDQQTLPPGSKMIDTPDQVFYVSRGLFRKINFAISCSATTVKAQKVYLKGKKAAAVLAKRNQGVFVIEGDINRPLLRINGKNRALPAVNLAVAQPGQLPQFGNASGPDIALKGRRLAQVILFHSQVAAGFSPADWRVDVHTMGPDSQPAIKVRTFRGSGAPPAAFKWDGTNKSGRFVLQPSTLYVARLTMTTLGGALSQSPLRVFGVGYTKRPPRVLFKRTLLADLMGRRGTRVNAKLKRALRKLKNRLGDLLRKPDSRLEIEVHHDSKLSRTKALFLTVRRAGAISRYLKRFLRLPDLNIKSRGLGSASPKLPNISRRNRRRNRRIIMRVVQNNTSSATSIPTMTYAASLYLGDKPIPINLKGLFKETHKVPKKSEPRIKITTPRGALIEIPLRPRFQKSAPAADGVSVLTPVPKSKQRFPHFDPGVILRDKERMLFSFRDAAGQSALRESSSSQPLFRLYLSTSSLERLKREQTQKLPRHAKLRVAQATATPPANRDTPADRSKTAPAPRTSPTGLPPTPPVLQRAAPVAPPVAPANRVVAPAIRTVVPAKRAVVSKQKALVKGKKVKKADPLKGLTSVPASQAKDVKAAQLLVQLPPRGAVIRNKLLIIKGTTAKGNAITINGLAVDVDKSGEFRASVNLKHGQKKLVVRSKDTEGNVGEIVWPVHVNLNRLFLMAFIDTAMAMNAQQLEGFNDHSSFKVGDVLFHGRAVLYAKGQLQGKHFLSKVFKQIKFTAHFDSAKKREMEDFYRQLIDPERYYPIYGDGSNQVQDVTARNKVYVMIEADRSKILVGNFRTQMTGIELKRYDRTFYGLDIDFRKRFAKHFDTRARFFLSDGEQKQLKAHIELRGTGGSLYYLKHRQLIEGSEQVRLTVRDKDSNIVLTQIPLQRNEHYSIQYFDGRLFFKYPIPSVVDSFVMTQHNLHTTMDGHPVFVEVDYEYEAVDGQGGLAFGVRVEQGFWDKIRVGFSFVQEGRADNRDPYRLWGFDLAFNWNKSTYIKAEYARSESFDSQSFISNDGGLSFDQIQHAFNNLSLDRNDAFNRPRPVSGNAVIVRGATDISKLAKWKNIGLNIGSYFGWREEGFFAAGQSQEQGSIKGGALLEMSFFKKHTLRLKYDGINTQRYDIITQRLYNYEQHIANINYTFNFLPNWDAVIEYSHTSNYDQRAESLPGNKPLLNGNFVTLGANWRVNKLFHILLKQQLAFATESREPLGVMDHFATTLGLGLRVFEDTFITGSGTVRWSGNTSAQIGLKTQLNKNTQVYVREQFNFAQQGTGLGHTLVVGAANSLTKNSKIYGEYQLDGQFSGTNSRAVVGLSHVFPVFKGFFVGAGFERAQFLDSATGNSSRTVGRITLQFTRLKQLKASGRYELRYDDNDEKAGLIGDRLQFVMVNNLAWQFNPDISFLARVNYALTHNAALNNGRGDTEGELFEVTAGLAFRPVKHDWFNMLIKYTHHQEVRPIGLTANSKQRTTNEVLSVVPIFELPFRLQIVEQFAMRYRQVQEEGLQEASSITVMWINRINFHLLKKLDIGIEYRLMWMWYGSAGEGLTTPANTPKTFDHGLLLEASYNIHKFVYVGAGYNFSSFSDNLLADPTRNYNGFFLRVVGKY